MTSGKGKNEQIMTELPNGYIVSTVRINGKWETMVFDKDDEEVYCHTEPYKNEAKHHHNMAVYKYLAA